MGTYEQPTVFTPEQLNTTKGLVAGIQSGVDAIGKGVQTRIAKDKKRQDLLTKNQKQKSKDLRSLITDFGKTGDYLDKTIDGKYDQTVTNLLNDLYLNYTPGTDEYDQKVSEIKVMASMSAAGMGHMQKYAGVARDFYLKPDTDNISNPKQASANGASLNSNDPVYSQMFIDFGVNHGASGNFFTEKDKIGWEFGYYELEDGSIVAKADMDRRFLDNPDLDPSEYTLKTQRLVFNGLSEDIESGAHIINGVDREGFNKFGAEQWKLYGKGTYDRYANKGGDKSTEEFTDESGKLITKEIISYEKANTAIKDQYLANAQNMTFNQNIWQSLGLEGRYTGDPEQKVEAAGKLADLAIKNNAKFDVVNYKNKAQKSSETAKMVNVYRNKRLPGAPREALVSIMTPNGPGKVNGYDQLARSGLKTAAGHTFGTDNAYQAGYVFEDYKTMASFYASDGNYGDLDGLGSLLTSMSPSDGVVYNSGIQMQYQLFEENKVEYINATGKGQMDDDFFTWLSGSDPNNLPNNPVPGANNINSQGFYKKSGSYLSAIQANDESQVLDLLLSEANITNASKNRLLMDTLPTVSGGGGGSSSSITKGLSGADPVDDPNPSLSQGVTTPISQSNFVMNSGVASYSPAETVIYDVNNIDELTGSPDKVPGLNFLIGIEETVGCVDAGGKAIPCGTYGKDKAMVAKTIKGINNSYLTNKDNIGKSYPGFKNDKMWGSDWEKLPENFKTTILQYGFNTSWDPRVVTLIAAGKINKADRGKYHGGTLDIDKKWNEVKGSIDYTKLDQNNLVNEMEDIYKNTYKKDGSENYKYMITTKKNPTTGVVEVVDPGTQKQYLKDNPGKTPSDFTKAKDNYKKYNAEKTRVTQPIVDKLNKIVDGNAKPLPGKEQEYQELIKELDMVFDTETKQLRPSNYPSYSARIELIRKRYK